MSIKQLAILGGDPEFNEILPVGQLYFPSRNQYMNAMKSIFDREYYTNNGPLLVEFEEKLASYLGVENVVAVTSNTLGLIIVAEALELKGKVIMPALTFVATALSLKRCGLSPVFCDIAPDSIFPSTQELEDSYQADISAMLGVNLWGGCAPISETESWAKTKKIEVYWDSAQAFGCEVDTKRVGNNGSAEIFSFHATKILSTAEGGCITTNNKELAEKMRNIRSSYGIQKPIKIRRTTNARMSEMQAALGLLALETIDEYIENNTQIRNKYIGEISSIPGISVMPNAGVSKSNNQNIVLLVDEKKFGLKRDFVVEALNAEGVIARRYFLPSLHKQTQFCGDLNQHLPNTESFQRKNIVMPIGKKVTGEAVERIGELLKSLNVNSARLRDYE